MTLRSVRAYALALALSLFAAACGAAETADTVASPSSVLGQEAGDTLPDPGVEAPATTSPSPTDDLTTSSTALDEREPDADDGATAPESPSVSPEPDSSEEASGESGATSEQPSTESDGDPEAVEGDAEQDPAPATTAPADQSPATSQATATTTTTTTTTTAAPEPVGDANQRLVGQFSSLAGQTVNLADFHNQDVVLWMWAPW